MYFVHASMKNYKKLILIVTIFITITLGDIINAQDGRVILTNNIGDQSSIWGITDEPTLVMNGFNLSPTSLRLPVVIDSITIEIFRGCI